MARPDPVRLDEALEGLRDALLLAALRGEDGITIRRGPPPPPPAPPAPAGLSAEAVLEYLDAEVFGDPPAAYRLGSARR